MRIYLGEIFVANIKSAKKRALKNEEQRKCNSSLKSKYKTYLKKVEVAIAASKKNEAMDSLKNLIPILDKISSKRVIHKNKAARYKSRLNNKIKNMI